MQPLEDRRKPLITPPREDYKYRNYSMRSANGKSGAWNAAKYANEKLLLFSFPKGYIFLGKRFRKICDQRINGKVKGNKINNQKIEIINRNGELNLGS
jgi:hypothetical protein